MEVIGVRLGHVARGVDLAVERHKSALASGFGHGCKPHGVEQIHLRVRTETVEGTLRARHHDRLVAVHGQVQEIRSLLKRVGALDIYQAVYVRRFQCLFGPQRELAQVVVRTLAIGVAVVDHNTRDLCYLGQRFEHLFASQSRGAACQIAQQVHPVLADTRQRPRPDHQLDTRQTGRSVRCACSGPGGLCLSLRWGWNGRLRDRGGGGSACCQMQKSTTEKIHDSLLKHLHPKDFRESAGE
jgi:hypothetical protein